MKPLTIEELKALEVGDWVWLIYKDTVYRRYAQIQAIEETRLYVWGRGLAECEMWKYSDYGTKWLAYKNKEQAESKITNGSILRMLSNAELADFLCSEDFQRLKMSYSSSVLGISDWLNAELTEEEAKRCLAELKGEKL